MFSEQEPRLGERFQGFPASYKVVAKEQLDLAVTCGTKGINTLTVEYTLSIGEIFSET